MKNSLGFKKNDEIVITIDDMGNTGEGIGHVDGYALFVKDALPGEVVKVRLMKLNKNYGFARLVEVMEKSPQRVEPLCPTARACGGCSLQHFSYEGQLAYKEKKVKDCLTRIGGLDLSKVEWLPILGMQDADAVVKWQASGEPLLAPWHYRNKAQFPVGRDREGKIVTGFYAGRSHSIIPIKSCDIQHPVINDVMELVLAFLRQYDIEPYDETTHTGLVRHIYIRRGYFTKEIMVCLVVNGTSLPHSEKLVECLCKIDGMTSISLNVNRKKTNVILGTQMISLWGPLYIEDTIGDLRYRISPQSFYQVNPLQTVRLYETALSFADLQGNEKVWDLYCGIGTISLFLAKKAAHVFGVEIVPEAVENAEENAKRNGIENATFVCGAAEDVAGEKGVDVIVVDPPRKGCDGALLETMVKMTPKKIVYVSCDPATLARDVKVLGEKGYEVKKVRACDMFPGGGHVETVVQLVRKTPDAYIDITVDMDELDLTASEAKATYQEIKDYIFEKHGVKVSSLYIAQVKEKHGIIERENYNKAKSEDTKQPKCPVEKERLIEEALKHFRMVQA